MPVLEGASDEVLAAGVGHMEDTEAGAQGNYVLAGHRVTHGEPFADLPDLEPGDEILVETRSATYTYVLDTGVRISHQTFGGRAKNGRDFVDNDAVAMDDFIYGEPLNVTDMDVGPDGLLYLVTPKPFALASIASDVSAELALETIESIFVLGAHPSNSFAYQKTSCPRAARASSSSWPTQACRWRSTSTTRSRPSTSSTPTSRSGSATRSPPSSCSTGSSRRRARAARRWDATGTSSGCAPRAARRGPGPAGVRGDDDETGAPRADRRAGAALHQAPGEPGQEPPVRDLVVADRVGATLVRQREVLGRLGHTVVEIADAAAWELQFPEIRRADVLVADGDAQRSCAA